MIFKFLVAVLAVTNAAHIQPTDLVDQALEQLAQLRALVRGEILAAHSELDQIIIDFGTHSSQVVNAGTIDLQQEHDTVLAEVQSIKDLAYSAGVDPTTCTDIREEVLNRLPDRYTEEIITCVRGVYNETRRIAEGAKYIVDISTNTVNHLEFEINRCREDLLCISPILNEIELDKIRLPQNIKTEVQACEAATETLKLSTGSCSNDKVAQYSTEAYIILANIQTCVNSLLN